MNLRVFWVIFTELCRDGFGVLGVARQSQRESGSVFDFPSVERFQRGFGLLPGGIAIPVKRIPAPRGSLNYRRTFGESRDSSHFQSAPGIALRFFQSAVMSRGQCLDMPHHQFVLGLRVAHGHHGLRSRAILSQQGQPVAIGQNIRRHGVVCGGLPKRLFRLFKTAQMEKDIDLVPVLNWQVRAHPDSLFRRREPLLEASRSVCRITARK